MRIAFIGGFDRLYDEEGKARSFEKLGCEVLRVSEVGFDDSSLNKIKEWSPDVVMSAKFLIEPSLRDDLFKHCRDNFIKTAAWHPDLYHYGPPVAGEQRLAWINNKAGLYAADYVFSPEGGEMNDRLYRRLGIKHHTVRQAPFDETVKIVNSADVSDLTDKESIDILFIGSMYQIADQFRPALVSFLQSEFNDRFLWLGQTEHQVREERLSTIISKTKIVMGESFYYPGYWSNRVYETIGRGGFILHPYVPGLEEEFEEGKECVFFDRWNFSDLQNKINYYLDPANEWERKSIVRNGMERVKKDHTLLNRCKQIMEILK